MTTKQPNQLPAHMPEDRLDWNDYIPVAPQRPSGTIRVNLIYKGRSKHIASEDDCLLCDADSFPKNCEDILAKLDKAVWLSHNWDSEGGKPTTADAAKVAKQLLIELTNMDGITPLNNGGVVIESDNLEIGFSPDGRLESVVFRYVRGGKIICDELHRTDDDNDKV